MPRSRFFARKIRFNVQQLLMHLTSLSRARGCAGPVPVIQPGRGTVTFQISGDRGTQLLRAAAPKSKKTQWVSPLD